MSHRRLSPLEGVVTDLQYARQALPGVPDRALLETEAAERLARAQAWLDRHGEGHHLVVWDSWRSRTTQRAIAERYQAELVAGGADPAAAREATGRFVASPEGVYPHGTGGTVDVTLGRGGEALDCGTGFDEFSARAHREWFDQHPPRTEPDRARAACQRLLARAMEHAGYVGLPHEWWHFEWGTRRWAAATGRPAVLESVLEP